MINIYISPFFPNENFGGDYKNTLTYQAYAKGEKEFATEIKSAVIKIFNAKDKSYISIRVVNKRKEVLKLAFYLFDYLAQDEGNRLKAQCNHTFVFRQYGDIYTHVGFSTDDILKEREFSLYGL